MIFVEPLEPWHVDAFLDNPREHEKRYMEELGGRAAFREMIMNLSAWTMGETFLDKDCNVVALWFVAQRNCGSIAVVFSYMTPLVDKYPLQFVRACKLCMDIMHKTLGIGRLEAFVDKHYPKSARWIQMLEHLGFKQEGPLSEHEIFVDSGVSINMLKQCGDMVMGRVW